MIEFDHITPQFRDVMYKTDQERLDFLGHARWIDYQAGNKLMGILDGLLRTPERPRMPNLMVVGASNCGKTTLITRFKNSSGKPYISDDAVSVRPVICAEVHKPDEREMYNAILREFWAPHNPVAPLEKLRHQAIHLLREARVRVLILDEIHTINNGSANKRMDVMNEVKMLSNILHIPLVLVGTRTALQLLGLDDQYVSRFDVVSLPAWSPNADFQRFLKSFESILPLKHASKIYSPELTTLIHAISNGNTGYVEALLRECARESVRSGAEVIDRKLLESKKWVCTTSANGVRERIL